MRVTKNSYWKEKNNSYWTSAVLWLFHGGVAFDLWTAENGVIVDCGINFQWCRKQVRFNRKNMSMKYVFQSFSLHMLF